MEVTGNVVKVVRRRTDHGSMFAAVTIAREGMHDITLKFLATGMQLPARGARVTIAGVPIVGRSRSNVGAASITVHE